MVKREALFVLYLTSVVKKEGIIREDITIAVFSFLFNPLCIKKAPKRCL
jgi:hypothetical protein